MDDERSDHDASGALVPGAQVTLVNTGTSAERTAVSDAADVAAIDKASAP